MSDLLNGILEKLQGPVAAVRELIAEGKVEGMERDEEIVARCFAALEDVATTHFGKRIIIVAHSHAIKLILHAIEPDEITFKTPLKMRVLVM